MTISEMEECIERMRMIYPFRNDRTTIHLPKDLKTCEEKTVDIEVLDEDSGVYIHLAAAPLIKE